MSKRENLVGQRFGRLTVLEYIRNDSHGHSYWECMCDCGNEIIARGCNLKRGHTTSCGCYGIKHYDDLIGKRFGRLSVIEYAGKDKTNNVKWVCKCDCGNEVVVLSNNLKSGCTTSCGCYRKERMTAHGHSYDPLYTVWSNMIQRCHNKNHKQYECYGGRGITVCDKWFGSFENFYNDMSEGYFSGLSLDRKDNNGDYEPGNCRWVDRTAQANNRRSNRFIEYDGESHTIAEWSKILHVNKYTLRDRVNRNDMVDFEKYFQNSKH